MKLKNSFNTKSIVKFLLEHLEKVIFVLFILVFVTIIYGAAMKREKFDKSPSQLITKCSDAQRVMEGDRDIKGREITNYAEKIAKFINQNGISVKPYECEVVWDKPISGIKGKRDQPYNSPDRKLLADVTELRAAAELGAFSVFSAPAAGEGGERPARENTGRPAVRPGRGMASTGAAIGPTSVQGKCWVALTGLVPFEEHLTAYQNAFRDAVGYDPENDTLKYLGYYVDRAEINSPADIQKPNWNVKIVYNRALDEAMKQWAPQNDVVDPKYIDTSLAFPLGPLQFRQWDKSVAHYPEIPSLLSEMAVVEGEKPGMEDNKFERRDENAGPGYGAPDNRRMVPMAGQRGSGRNVYVRENKGAEDADSMVKYKLLRFFDFSVEPGKSYIYKVRLVLNNPNFGKDPGRLQTPELAKNKYLETPGAGQSNVVYVPVDTRVLVDTVKSKTVGEPSGVVHLVKWLKKTGQEVHYAPSAIERGQVLNFKDVKPDAVLTMDQMHGSRSDVPPPDNTNFITNATVLDMDGGKKIAGKDKNLTEPGDVLLMLVRGKSLVLMDHNELDDMPEVQRVTVKPESPQGIERNPRGQPLGRGETDAERRLLDGGGDKRPRNRP